MPSLRVLPNEKRLYELKDGHIYEVTSVSMCTEKIGIALYHTRTDLNNKQQREFHTQPYDICFRDRSNDDLVHQLIILMRIPDNDPRVGERSYYLKFREITLEEIPTYLNEFIATPELEKILK